MRPLTIAGILLAVLGAFILVRGLTYRSDRSVLKVGDLEAKVEERRTIPPWVGGVALLGGIVLIGMGARGRKP
jgi:hypothetical protein